jgi:hypothetical protein
VRALLLLLVSLLLPLAGAPGLVAPLVGEAGDCCTGEDCCCVELTGGGCCGVEEAEKPAAVWTASCSCGGHGQDGAPHARASVRIAGPECSALTLPPPAVRARGVAPAHGPLEAPPRAPEPPPPRA